MASELNVGGLVIDSGGSLSAVDGDLTIQSSAASHQGLRLGSSYVAPTNNVGALEDDSTALGLVSVRFTDAFFSGTVNSAGIVCSSMPTSDPSVAGQLWNDSGTVKISAG